MTRYFLLIAAITLSGCGGGDGGGDTSTPATPATRLVNDSVIVNAGESATVAVLANDTNPTLPISIATPPSSGGASINGNEISYSPTTGFTGIDSLTYRDAQDNTALLSITVNASPNAIADSFEVIENTPTTLDILANDTDSDGTLSLSATKLEISGTPAGNLALENNLLRYTPPTPFLGSDSFTYRVLDANGATSNPVVVLINVIPITQTALRIVDLPLPTTGYTQTGSMLVSPVQTVRINPNAVSFLLSLQGTVVGPGPAKLTLVDVAIPNGATPHPDSRFYLNCDALLCTLYQPKSADETPLAGGWQYRIAANATTLSAIDLAQATLQLAERTGPSPKAPNDTSITIQPFVTSHVINDVRLADVLAELRQLAEHNGFQLDMAEPRRLDEPRFVEVSADFADVDTRDLVMQGDPGAVNIFFVESFAGINNAGRIAIAPGIPGALGDVNNLNGVLINGTLNLNVPSIYARTTAEFAFHEMGHLLGLFHTTERFFGDTDIIEDTPACTPSEDANANGEANTGECPDGLNIMFWTNDLDRQKEVMSPLQRQILYRAPIARMAAE